jgi:hypothetical protein
MTQLAEMRAVARPKDFFMRRLLSRRFICAIVVTFAMAMAAGAQSGVFGRVQGIVHDPQHRPLPGATVTLAAAASDYRLTAESNTAGAFQFPAVPLGTYTVTVAFDGLAPRSLTLTLASGASPILHFELAMGLVRESVTATASAINSDTVTPTTLLDRTMIAETPGAGRTYGLQMITDYVPGAYITHDMLHMRGGHQVTWEIDGVEIPQTNIASNLGPQIAPGDIDYLQVERGSYAADEGDRTYGVFNVAPRNGFERNDDGELTVSAGNFLQTNDQLGFGSHTQTFAYYASLEGNRSDYGLSPPVAATHHDAANGGGAFVSLIDNRTPKDQFRMVGGARRDYFQIPYDPDANDFENQQFQSAYLRDGETEEDAYAAFTWAHEFSSTTLLQVSPLYHSNVADYDSSPLDTPVVTTEHHRSQYGGAQAQLATEIANNYFQAGVFSFGQHDDLELAALPGLALTSDAQSGGLVEAFVSDNYKIAPWLTLIGGLRQSHFQAAITDNSTAPRIGIAATVPRLGWVFRGFYGRFYQAPPLITDQGPLLGFANGNNTTPVPLHGERDEEHQFGVQIPYRGWMLDADTFKTRANNFLDHANIGDSSIYLPVTVDGALIRGWELTLRSPRVFHAGQFHLAYSNQIAEQRGNITGGLICVPVGSAACDAGFNYTPVDHDQRNTLSVGFNGALPWRGFASANVAYGSGFTNGDADIQGSPYTSAYLPAHSSVDISAGKSFGENWTASVTVLNVANERTLLDNSLTFGGFHFSDPRQVYGEVKWRFKY